MFDRVCPYYMSIGMTYDDFWHGEPDIARCFREAHELRNEARNQEMWMQGLYVYDAFKAVIEGAFAKNSRASYMAQPIDIYPEKHKEEEAERQRKEIIENLKRFQTLFNKGKQNGSRETPIKNNK